MPQVPYEGYPTRTASFEPTPSISVNTPPAAFGVNVAEAVEHLGNVQQGAGKELFDRAYAMQELQAHANAMSAVTDVQNRQLQAELTYRQLQGKDAVDAYPALQTNLDSIREAGVKNLSPYERMLADQETRSTTFRAKFSAGAYAADQQKSYNITTSKAAVSSAINASGTNLDDDKSFQDYIDKIKREGNYQADQGGFPADNPKHILDVKTDTSLAYERRIRALADAGKFTEAETLKGKGIESGDLISTGTDYRGRTTLEALQDHIDEKRRTVGVRHAVTEASGKGTYIGYGDGVVTLPQAQIGVKAVESSGGDYTALGPTVPATKDHPSGNGLGAFQVMSYNLSPWLKEAGLPDMTPEQFRANTPEARNAQNALFNFKFGQLMDHYKSYNAALHAWFGWGKTDGYSTADAYIAKANAAAGRPMSSEDQARLIASNAAMGKTASQADRVAAAGSLMRSYGGSDDDIVAAEDGMITQIGRENALQRDMNQQNYDTVESFVLNGKGSDGNLPTTTTDLMLDPKAEAGYNYLIEHDPKGQKQIQNLLASNVGSGPPDSDAWVNEFSKLSGMSVRDPKQFMDETENLAKFPRKYRNELVLWRRAIAKGEEANPDLRQAMAIPSIQQRLRDLNIGPKDGMDRDNYDLFAGALRDQLDLYAKNNGGKRPDEAAITEIAGRLLQEMPVPGSFFSIFGGGSGGADKGVPFFEMDVPFERSQEYINTIQQNKGYIPSDQEVRQWWIGQEYQNKYGKPTEVPKGGGPK